MSTRILNYQSVEQAKQFPFSNKALGLMINQLPSLSKITFEKARCSSLENSPEQIQELKQGNCVFVLTREDKIKYFFFSKENNQMFSVSFRKPLRKGWKEFYLETLSQVFGPEA